MLELGVNNFNVTMVRAALRGHQNIVELMLEKGATNYNHAISISFYGHESIVRLMLDRGANNYNGAITEAASQGHQNIVRLIWERMNSLSS